MVSHVCFLTSNDHSATGLFGFDRFDGELEGVFVFSHNKEGNVPRTHCGETNGGRVDFFSPNFFSPSKEHSATGPNFGDRFVCEILSFSVFSRKEEGKTLQTARTREPRLGKFFFRHRPGQILPKFQKSAGSSLWVV